MAEIEKFPKVLYEALQPYHYHYDNLPILNLLTLTEVVNYEVERNSSILNNSIGSMTTLAARLGVALEDDGTLKSTAIDAADHTIDNHTDTENFVRMTKAERDQLALTAPAAKNLTISVYEDEENPVDFPNQLEAGVIKLKNSESITWAITAPDILKAHMAFPAEIAHSHNYEITPVFQENISGESYFQTTSVNTPFIEGTLRVYINGVRIFTSGTVYVPDADNANYYLTNFTVIDESDGTFKLNRIIDPNVEIIRIDFDSDYTE